ncbi:MAG: DUF2062 domain-containing protein [Pseudomonadota bacterium]
MTDFTGAPPKQTSRLVRWRRNTRAMFLKVARFRDDPHRITIGLCCGIFMSFSPFFGFHFLMSMALAYLLSGNIKASLIGTAAGNPVTFPIIATSSIALGDRILGRTGEHVSTPILALKDAGSQIWTNFVDLLFGVGEPMQWGSFADVWQNVFLPYMLGGMVYGGVAALASFFVLRSAIAGFKAARLRRIKARRLSNAKKRERSAIAPQTQSAN